MSGCATLYSVVSSAFTLEEATEWPHLLATFRAAAKGKRNKDEVAGFEVHMADGLLALQAELRARRYHPGPYRTFVVHEAKRRKITAAPFRDRVVHHALVRAMEPTLEAGFSDGSFANRTGRGTHRAIERFQALSARYSYVLRMDIVKYFPSIDHALLKAYLHQRFTDDGVRWLLDVIIDSGAHLEAKMPAWLSGDGLFDGVRPRGLPFGNLTSQIWSNAMLDPIDQLVTRQLGHTAYVRYVDDLAVFSNSKRRLWSIKSAIQDGLRSLRLRCHERQAQVMTTAAGVPWLGFVVWPDRRRVKARKVRHFTRRFRSQWAAYEDGRLSFAELDASVRGFLTHIDQADARGWVQHVMGFWPANEPRSGWRPKMLRGDVV
ncbi:MAG: RNA-directed DNA polymerase [Myxococcota bacterium]